MPQIFYERVPAITQILDTDCWLASAGMLARYHQDYNVYAKLPKGDFWRKVQTGLDHEEAGELLAKMGFTAVSDRPANQTKPQELYAALAAHGPLWFPQLHHVVVLIGIDTDSDMALVLDPQVKINMVNPERAKAIKAARVKRTGINRDWDSGIWDGKLSELLRYASAKASVHCLKTGKPPKLPDSLAHLDLATPKSTKVPDKKADALDRLGLDSPKNTKRKLPQ